MVYDEEREARIENEIIVDAYGPEEQAMGWYCYLDEHLHIPFRAQCITMRTISPLRKGEVVTVTGMAPVDDCMYEMFVLIQWQDRTLGVPLAQLQDVDADEQTEQAIADWQYWMAQGYQLKGGCSIHRGNVSESNFSQSSTVLPFEWLPW